MQVQKNFKIILGTLLALFCIVLFLSSAFFYITDVNISGNNKLSKEEILAICNLNTDTNIFWFSSSKYEKIIEKDNYIKSCSIRKNYSDKTVDIVIDEARLSGYVEYVKGTYLYIDETGLVLEAATSYKNGLPLVVGLNFSKFTVGAPLENDEPRKFNAVVLISQLLNKYNLQNDVTRIDLSDLQNIHFYIEDVLIHIGTTQNIDEKIRMLVAIMNNYEDFKTVSGTLDLSNENVDATLKFND